MALAMTDRPPGEKRLPPQDSILYRRWMTGFWLVLAALAAVIWLLRLVTMLDRGAYYQTTGFEEVTLHNLSRLRYGDPIYVDCFQYPYRASLFNWFFYCNYGLVVALFNPSEFALPAIARLVTVAWAVTGCVTTYRFLARNGPAPESNERWLIGSLAIVTWCGPFLGWWTLTARPDVPALVCQFLGLAIVIRDGARLTFPRVLLAGSLFFLAWSFKQNGVFIFAGTLLALLMRREWQNLVRLGSVFGFLVGLVLVAAEPAYYTNLFQALTLAPFELRQLEVILFWVRISWGPLLLVGLTVWLLVLQYPERRAVLQTRAGYFLGVILVETLCFNLLGVRRVGSSANYFFESWLIGMLLTGLLVRQAYASFEAFRFPAHRVGFLLFLAVLFAYSVLCTLPLFEPFDKPETAPIELMVRLPRAPFSPELLEEVRRCNLPMYCDDSFLARQALGTDAGELPIVDYTIYPDAVRAGKIRDGGIERRIRQQEFEHLWLYAEASPWEKVAKDSGYKLLKEEGLFKHYARPTPDIRIARLTGPMPNP